MKLVANARESWRLFSVRAMVLAGAIRTKLVADAHESWRWFSVQIPAVNTAFLGTWAMLPDRFQEALPMPWVLGIAITLIVMGVGGRLIDQTPKEPTP